MCISNFVNIHLGQFLFGIGLGSSYTTSLIYLSHWSLTRIRGKLMVAFGISSSCGQFFSLLVGHIIVKLIFTILHLHINLSSFLKKIENNFFKNYYNIL